MKTILVLLLIFPSFIYSQKAEKKEVRKVIDLLFDGMKKGDSSQVRKTLLPNATLNTSFINSKGRSKITPGFYQLFFKCYRNTSHGNLG